MNQLNHQRLRTAFQHAGYSERDYIDKNSLADTLGKLGNEQFDSDVLEQLWEQCKLNSQGKTKVDTFIDNVIRAEAILIQKQKQTGIAAAGVETKLLRETNNIEVVNLRNELSQLQQIKTGFAIDLEILRKPFLGFAKETIYRKGGDVDYDEPQGIGADASAIIPISNKMNLTWVMDLSLLCLLGEIFITLYLNTFMNAVLFLMILSLCLFEYFDRPLIRFLFWSTIFTLIVEIVWFCIAAHGIWAPGKESIYAKFISGYLKFSVILIAIIFLLKLLIAMLLCSEYNIDESQPQQISLLSKKFILTKQKQSPIRKALHGILSANVQKSVVSSHVRK